MSDKYKDINIKNRTYYFYQTGTIIKMVFSSK